MEYLFVTLIILQLTASQRLTPEVNLQHIDWMQPEYQQKQQQQQYQYQQYHPEDLQPPNHYQTPQQLDYQHLRQVHPNEQQQYFQPQPIPIEDQQNRQPPIQLRTFNDWTFDDLKKLLILPGTHLCGIGNNSKSYKDVGTFTEVDKCCRDHDHCDNISANESKHNLTDTSGFTSSSCECDLTLQRCLKKINDFFSNFAERIYFDNPFRRPCYSFVDPTVQCTTRVMLMGLVSRCMKLKRMAHLRNDSFTTL